MLRGLYTAASGMITESLRTDTISNNLANVDTTGYKKDTMVSEEFEAILLHRINDKQNNATSIKGFSVGQEAPVVGPLGRGSKVSEIATIQDQGALQTTGNPYDLAISGKGYFVVNTPQGNRYTRNGNFYRSNAGQLVTVDGQAVLDNNNRPITLPQNAKLTFGANGQVSADNQPLTTLQLVDFQDRRALLKEGNNLFFPQQGAQPTAATGTISQGVLEKSNVNVVSEMVQLINNYRMYEANSKSVTTQDSLLDKAVNEVGRL